VSVEPLVQPNIAAGLSSLADPSDAAIQAADQCASALAGAEVTLAFVFASRAHMGAIPVIISQLERRLSPACLIGCTAQGVLAGRHELEDGPGLSLLACSFPGTSVSEFTDEEFPRLDGPALDVTAGLLDVIGDQPDTRATFFFADPFSVPLIKLLPAFNAARSRLARMHGVAPAPIFGVLDSAGLKAGENVVILNGRLCHAGAVGVTLCGDIAVDAVVSQGCRPFGQPMVVTKSKGNVIFELSGRPAIEMVQEAVESLDPVVRPK
jgi:small ligand-binding sensory domain FIST